MSSLHDAELPVEHDVEREGFTEGGRADLGFAQHQVTFLLLLGGGRGHLLRHLDLLSDQKVDTIWTVLPLRADYLHINVTTLTNRKGGYMTE